MKHYTAGLMTALGLSSATATEFILGPSVGDTQFHQPNATDVGQVFIFPSTAFESTFQLNSLTFWGKASPATVEFKIGYVNGNLFYEGASSTYTFLGGGGDGQFETIHFDFTDLLLPTGYYALGYFTGLPENASFKLNSWSTDEYTSELNYLSLHNAQDPNCSIYYKSEGSWSHYAGDLGFIADITATYTGAGSTKTQPTSGFLPGVQLAGGFYPGGGGGGGTNVPDQGATLGLLTMAMAGLMWNTRRRLPTSGTE